MKQVFYALILLMMAQSCTQRVAQKSFEKGYYDRAIELYKKSLDPQDAHQNFMLGESYRKSNRLQEAAPYYSAARRAGSREPGLPYYLARSLKANKQYEEAEKILRDFLTKAGGDSNFKALAQVELDNLTKIDVLQAETNYFRIKNLDELNTKFAEYSPVYHNGFLYFTSNREGHSKSASRGGWSDWAQADSNSASSRCMLTSFSLSVIRSDLIRRILILSTTSPRESATFIIHPFSFTSFTAAKPNHNPGSKRGCPNMQFVYPEVGFLANIDTVLIKMNV